MKSARELFKSEKKTARAFQELPADQIREIEESLLVMVSGGAVSGDRTSSDRSKDKVTDVNDLP